jgi:polyisoprenoid-binding protein YceI
MMKESAMIHRLALLALSASSALGFAADTWTVVPEQSTVVFHASSTLHDFDGSATVAGGQVDLTPGHESGWAAVTAASMKTGNESRDRKMHDKHMESATHPEVRFTLVKLERTADTTIAHGTWAMHGVSKDIAIPVTLPTAEKPHLTATFPIDMRDWKIEVPGTMLVIRVDPVVTVTVDLTVK